MSARQTNINSAPRVVPAGTMRQALQQAFRSTDAKVWNAVVDATTGELPPVVADLLDVARSLFVADCQHRRPASWTRKIPVTLTVREHEVWKRKGVLEALSYALAVAGNDAYTFRVAAGRRSTTDLPRRLALGIPCRVCLLSDGLDSLCGLIHRLMSQSGETFFAVSALTQYLVEGHVKETVPALNRSFNNRVVSVPIPLYRRGYRLRRREELSQRSRSVLLLILGAVVALAAGQRQVEISENGIELFNSPLAPCLEPQRLSRAMSPLILARMSTFISILVGEPFEFMAPFGFQTKTDMVRATQEYFPTERLEKTISCLRYRSVQCGYCQGCVLRRIAFLHTSVAEPRAHYKFDIFTGKKAAGEKTAQHLMEMPIYTMNSGVYNLHEALRGPNAFRSLMNLSGINRMDWEEFFQATARATGVSPARVPERMLDLYRRYAKEWEDMRPKVNALPPYCAQHTRSESKEVSVG